MGVPWNNWYHCMCGTYGTWLRGDPRGWRERWHREHVEGDYRNPPAKGTFEKLYEQSKRAMKREEVRLSRELRRGALESFVEKLVEKEIEVVAACLDDHHLHVLARFPGHDPRRWVGMAKRNSAFAVRAFEDGPAGGIWSKKSKCEPVRDRAHQVNVVRYIVAHGKRGAVVWVNPVLREKKNAHG